MSQQPIANNADYPLMSSAHVNRKSSSHQPKTAEEQPLPRLANDSFETKHKSKKTKMASPKPTIEKQGVPLIGAGLIALVSLGLGSGVMLLGAKHNWFELGKQVETKTVKELPEALNNLLNAGGTPLTEEQAIKAVKDLQQGLEKGITDLAEAHKTIAKRADLINFLQTEKDEKIIALEVAKQKLAAKNAELVEATKKLNVLLTVPDDKGNFMDNFVGKKELRNQIRLLEVDKAEFAQQLGAARSEVDRLRGQLEQTIKANRQEIADLKKSHGEALELILKANADMQAKVKAAGGDVFDGSPIKLIDLDKPLKDELEKVKQQLEWAIQQNEEYQQVIKELGEHQEQLLNMPQADTSFISQKYEDYIQDLVIQHERDLHDARQGSSTVQQQNQASQYTSQLALPSLGMEQNTAARTVQPFLGDTTGRQIVAPLATSHQSASKPPDVLLLSEPKIESPQDYPYTPFNQRLRKFVKRENPVSPTTASIQPLALGESQSVELPRLEAPSSLADATELRLPSVSSKSLSFDLNANQTPVANPIQSDVDWNQEALEWLEESDQLTDADLETRQWLDASSPLTDEYKGFLDEVLQELEQSSHETNPVLEQSVGNSTSLSLDELPGLSLSSHKNIHFSSLAFEELEALAIGGNPEAQAELGSRYFLGDSQLKPDFTLSFQWYEKAALQEHAKAQHKLGFFYENGIGVEQNQELADYWYGKAEQNESSAN